jgi:hypothetical protein
MFTKIQRLSVICLKEVHISIAASWWYVRNGGEFCAATRLGHFGMHYLQIKEARMNSKRLWNFAPSKMMELRVTNLRTKLHLIPFLLLAEEVK